jgi:hypothetical protein
MSKNLRGKRAICEKTGRKKKKQKELEVKRIKERQRGVTCYQGKLELKELKFTNWVKILKQRRRRKYRWKTKVERDK